MRITSFSIDAGSWRDGTYHIRPGSSATASIIVFVKVGENSDATKIKHVCDIEKALNMEDIDSYLGINVLISLVTHFGMVICFIVDLCDHSLGVLHKYWYGDPK